MSLIGTSPTSSSLRSFLVLFLELSLLALLLATLVMLLFLLLVFFSFVLSSRRTSFGIASITLLPDLLGLGSVCEMYISASAVSWKTTVLFKTSPAFTSNSPEGLSAALLSETVFSPPLPSFLSFGIFGPTRNGWALGGPPTPRSQGW